MTVSDRRRRVQVPRAVIPIVAIVLVIVGVVGIAMGLQGSSPPTVDQLAEQRGVAWARNEIVWSAGPSIRSQAVFPLRELPARLRALPSQTRQDVDVRGLDRQYGKNARVAMVVMHGTYNSLPPDEGVNLSGDIVVLVSVRTRHVILNVE